MPATPPLDQLRAGDCLLYRPTGWVGWLIALKTWHRVAHVEIYDSDGSALASRDGIGVNRYTVRVGELCRILRPTDPARLDWPKAVAWFERCARGQRYDFKALLRYLVPGYVDPDLDRMICSALAVRLYRAGGYPVFAPGEDADRIAPAQFLLSPTLTEVWSDGRPV